MYYNLLGAELQNLQRINSILNRESHHKLKCPLSYYSLASLLIKSLVNKNIYLQIQINLVRTSFLVIDPSCEIHIGYLFVFT